MYKCSKCGTEFDGNFCPNCGEKRPQNKFCPNCGKPLEEDFKVCPYCGFGFQPAAASGAKVQAAKYYKILSVLPAVFMALFAIMTILAVFVMPAVLMFDESVGTLFDDFKVKGFSGYDCLNGAASASMIFGFVALVLSAGYFACAFLHSCSEAKIKIGKRSRDLPFIFDIFAVLIMLAQLITSAVCMGIIGADDGGAGLVKPGAGLILPLVFSILFMFAVPACSQINKRVILRRNPEVRSSSYYYTVRGEFTSAVPAPETKENSELYSRSVTYYRQKAALIACNIFVIVMLMNFICYICINTLSNYDKYDLENKIIVLDVNLIITYLFAFVGLFASLIIFFCSKRSAIKKMTDLEHFNKVRNKKISGFTALFSVLFTLPWFSINCLSHAPFLSYSAGASTSLLRSSICSLGGLYFEIALYSFCFIYGLALAIATLKSGLKIDKFVYEETERPEYAKQLKWWWNIIPYFQFYAYVIEIRWAVHSAKVKKVCKISEEEFKTEIDKYGEYLEYKRQLAIYRYKAHVYAKEKLAGGTPDVTAIAGAEEGKAKVWLYNNAAYLVLAAVAIASLAVIAAIAAAGASAAAASLSAPPEF